MSLRRFTLLFLLYIALIGFAAEFLNNYFEGRALIPKFWVIFGAMAVLTWSAYFVSYLGIKKGGELSVYGIMGAIIVKLLLTMLFALVYLLKINVDKVIFVINFIGIYFLFSGFEIWGLLANLRLQNKSE